MCHQRLEQDLYSNKMFYGKFHKKKGYDLEETK